MNTFIALFRGINVGGHNKLPMRELVTLLEGLDLQNVQTYIQSGNVIFKSQKSNIQELSGQISTAIQKNHGFAPAVLVLSAAEFEQAVRSNPYPEAETESKSLHVYFLESEPQDPDLEKLETIKRENERFTLKGNLFYLHAPDGIGRSKLAERVERALAVTTTARNWRTVEKISAMINR